MPDAQQLPSFFADQLSPQAVREAQTRQSQQDAFSWANLQPGAGQVAAAAMAGSQFGGAAKSLLGQNPQIEHANKLERVRFRVKEADVSLDKDPDEYYQKVIEELGHEGLVGEAQRVHEMVKSDRAAKAQAALDERAQRTAEFNAGSSRLKAQADMLAAGTPKKSDVVSYVPSGTPHGDTSSAIPVDMSTQEGKEAAAKLISSGYIPIGDIKAPKTDTINKVQVSAGASAASNMLAKDTSETTQRIRKAFNGAVALQPHIKTIQRVVGDATSTFGTAAEARSLLHKAALVFSPNTAADIIQNVTLMDSTDFDQVHRASKAIVTSMMADTPGVSKMTNAILKTIEDAGASVFQTNEGLAIIAKIMEKRTERAIDAGTELVRLNKEASAIQDPDERNKALIEVGRKMFAWEVANKQDEKYNMTEADVKEAKTFARKAQTTNAILKDTKRTPWGWDTETNERFIDPAGAGYEPGDTYFDDTKKVWRVISDTESIEVLIK